MVGRSKCELSNAPAFEICFFKHSKVRECYLSKARALEKSIFQTLDRSQMRAFKNSIIRKLEFSGDRALENERFQMLERSEIRFFNHSNIRKCDLSFTNSSIRKFIFQTPERSNMRVFESSSLRKLEFSSGRALENASLQMLQHSKI